MSENLAVRPAFPTHAPLDDDEILFTLDLPQMRSDLEVWV